MKIELKNVSKTYQSGDQIVEVFEDISLKIASGQRVAIQGESGSGKSTLLNLIGLLDSPDSGDILHDERCVSNLPKSQYFEEMQRIGFVFQNYHLIPTLSILKNVMLPLKITRQKDSAKKAERILGKVGLPHRVNHYPSEISGGEMQRACVARAIVNNPKLILADEPTGNLDEQNTENVVKILLDLAKESHTTLICVTHSHKVANCFDTKSLMDEIKGDREYSIK